jgi:hypothetical protein
VPNLSANLLFVSFLTQTCNIVECLLDQFYVHDLKNDKLIFTEGILDPKDNLYKFCDTT